MSPLETDARQTDNLTHAIERFRVLPAIKAFFESLHIDPENQKSILHLGLNLILQRAEAFSVAERRGVLNHLSEKTVLNMINHTGMTHVFLLSQERSREENEVR